MFRFRIFATERQARHFLLIVEPDILGLHVIRYELNYYLIYCFVLPFHY